MMDTPICDFVRTYAQSGALRLHMPGHKGEGPLGLEALDITEIPGADSLYEADGVIARSEANASRLFGAPTFYSTEGSSLCIRAMLSLAQRHAASQGRRPVIAAGRNAHKTFLSAAALLGLPVRWLTPRAQDAYLSCVLSAEELDAQLGTMDEPPAAVYLTSPDYLGNTADVAALAAVCHRRGALLLVDNAHGAYLRFLETSRHPIDLGADLCCDSAHKTLPVLTGGAYLHIAKDAPAGLAAQAKDALALFGSTSPSYLILQSLDAANRALAEGYRERLSAFLPHVQRTKDALRAAGHQLCGDEPLKLTLRTKPYGYRGTELAALLAAQGVVCEFADPDFLVMMLTPEIGESGLLRMTQALAAVLRRDAIPEAPPAFGAAERAMGIREAMLAPAERVPVMESEGRVLSSASVGCPPAVPVLVCGERIDRHAIRCFEYYGIKTCMVVKE